MTHGVKSMTAGEKKRPATLPENVAAVTAEGRRMRPVLVLYVWLVAITGVRRGELCALQVRDIDLDNGVVHIAFNYVVSNAKQIRKDTKTHQDRLGLGYPQVSDLAAAAGVKLDIRVCDITRRASCSRRGSACRTPPLGLATAEAGQPRCGTMLTRFPRSTGAHRLTWRN
jgi:integrase